MTSRFTIVGGRGFIGAALATSLRAAGHEVTIVAHADDLAGRDLHHVVYASGIAASNAGDPGYAFAVHVAGAARILAHARFDSFLFLSSTRVYDRATATDEDATLAVAPARGEIYRISKLAGEALCLAHPAPSVRVARLSNIVGPSFDSPLFLSDVLRQAARGGRARVRTVRDSAKDYLTVGDACRYLTAIALGGAERIYNVATGHTLTNGAIYDALAAAGVEIAIDPAATLVTTPAIDARRLHAAFGAPREDVLASLPALYAAFVDHARAHA
jgi:nucleoside-diphosphate-sugar epimerase